MTNLKYLSFSIGMIIPIFLLDIHFYWKFTLIFTIIILVLITKHIQSIGFDDRKDTITKYQEIINKFNYFLIKLKPGEKLFIIIFISFIFISWYIFSNANAPFIYSFTFGFLISLYRNRHILANLDNKTIITNIGIYLFTFNFLFLFSNYLDIFNNIYCDDKDKIIIKDDVKDDNYNFSVSKNFVNEGISSIISSVVDRTPEVIAGLAGGKAAVTMINKTAGVPPVKRGLIGVATAAGVSLAIGVGAGIAKKINQNLISESINNDVQITIPNSVINELINKDTTIKKVVESSNIKSVLDNFDSLTPLESLVNYEIFINIMLLIHLIIIGFIILDKYFISNIRSGGVEKISKFISKEKLEKLNIFMNKISKFTDKYLLILLVINILIVLFYIFCNIYISIELSNNLEDYIRVHNHLKQIKS